MLRVPFFVIFIITFLPLKAQIDLDFSHKRGYYDAPFLLNISTDNADAIIKYTTNNTQPSPNNGLVYTTPINISSTTVLKAIVYSPTETGMVRSHSFLFLNDIKADPTLYSYITTNSQYINLLDAAFKSLPVVSIAGAAVNSTNNITIEIPVSTELFFPDGSKKGFMINNGLQTWGGSESNPKKNYRLEFKEIYGDKKLDYKLFEPDNYDNTDYKVKPVDEFDVLILRAGSQDALNGEFGNENLVQYVRNRVMLDMQMEMGHLAPHGRFVHLFVNGKYNGQYHLMERPDPAFFESYFGGNKTDYEVYKNGEYWNQKDSIATLYKTIGYYVNFSSVPSIKNTQKNFDLDSAADYLVLMSYAGGWDWSDVQNCLSGGNINPGQLSYKYMIWDVDYSFGNGGIWYPNYTGDIAYFNAPITEDGPIPDNMLSKLEFRIMLSDKMTCACYNNGVLTPAVADSFYMHRINQVKTSLIAESAKWGDNNFTYAGGGGTSFHIAKPEWDVNDEFMTELNRVRTDFIPNRPTELIKHYRSKGISSYLEPVQCSSKGGIVVSNTTITLTNTNNTLSEIYYTLDGSDPRAIGGTISPTAKLYTAPITLTKGTKVLRARVRNQSYSNTNIRKWSSMCPVTFYVDQNYQNLVINEIHYNPADSIVSANGIIDTIGGSNFEFIELKNIGFETIYLKDVQFDKGLRFKFDELFKVPPQGFVVLAKNEEWFMHKYGFLADGKYFGKLSNNGERIWLTNPQGEVIDSINYKDQLPWDTIPDNGNFSLALLLNATNNSLATSWKSQDVQTTPKAENEFCTTFSYKFTKQNISCYNANDGFISVNALGGKSPYFYNWNTGNQSSQISDLSAQTYSLSVIDGYGCTFDTTFQITEPDFIDLQIQTTNATSVMANNGSSTAIVAGGIAPYNYIWSDGSTNNNLTNLGAGTYNVSVLDANYCTRNTTFEILPERCFENYISLNNDTIYSGLYKAAAVVSINGLVLNGNNVLVEAGDSIILNKNFQVNKQSNFEIKINDCN